MTGTSIVDSSRAWIQVSRGGPFHILDPQQDEIHEIDIAHALSMICRFTGHVRRFYSVAEHSVHVSRIVPEEFALWGLLHDSPEAYIADLNRPLKHFTDVGPTYMKVEEKIMRAICTKFRLDPDQPEEVTNADFRMLWCEKDQLMLPAKWDQKWGTAPEPANVVVRCWAPEVAETMFLHRFYELTQKL